MTGVKLLTGQRRMVVGVSKPMQQLNYEQRRLDEIVRIKSVKSLLFYILSAFSWSSADQLGRQLVG